MHKKRPDGGDGGADRVHPPLLHRLRRRPPKPPTRQPTPTSARAVRIQTPGCVSRVSSFSSDGGSEVLTAGAAGGVGSGTGATSGGGGGTARFGLHSPFMFRARPGPASGQGRGILLKVH